MDINEKVTAVLDAVTAQTASLNAIAAGLSDLAAAVAKLPTEALPANVDFTPVTEKLDAAITELAAVKTGVNQIIADLEDGDGNPV